MLHSKFYAVWLDFPAKEFCSLIFIYFVTSHLKPLGLYCVLYAAALVCASGALVIPTGDHATVTSSCDAHKIIMI